MYLLHCFKYPRVPAEQDMAADHAGPLQPTTDMAAGHAGPLRPTTDRYVYRDSRKLIQPQTKYVEFIAYVYCGYQ